MKRHAFISLLGGAAAAWPLARTQQTKRVRRIGVLETVSVTLNAANYDALHLFGSRAGTDSKKFREAADEIERLRAETVFCFGSSLQ